ncbi:LCP family protein [Frankia canadensis]|uniref:LCP family protein n=1 Tax=Frankia canadensis TaxID=1836972 RepID=UPI001401D1A2
MTDAPPRPSGSATAGKAEFAPRRERSTLGRLTLVLAAGLSALVLLTTVGGWTAYQYFGAQIHRIRLGLGDDRPADAAAGNRNYLLAGSDSRAGTGNEYQRGGAVSDERSDTTMLAHLDADGTTTMVSFPRDTLVRIPGHGRGKINSAITLGGPSLLIRTIEDLTDIRIDHYVSIDLAGFKAMTDALGGVTVCVKALANGSRSNLYDPWSQWRGHVGQNTLSGEQALAFVRQRHGLPDNDFDRIRRQQQFIGAVFTRATSSGVLANPIKLESLLHAATKALTVDDGTSINDLRALATRLRGMSADQIRFETIPVHTPTPAEGANAIGELPRFGAVQLYSPIELEKFLAPLRGRPGRASTPSAASPSASPTALPAARVRVDVYNGAGVRGLASSAATRLTSAGFQVGSPRTWSGASQRTTQVRYHPGDEAAARTLLIAVPGSRMQPDSGVPAGRVRLVLGTAFTVDSIVTPVSTSTAGTDGATGGGEAGTGVAGGTTPDAAPGTGAMPGSGAGTSTSAPNPTTTATQLTTGCTY